MISAFAYFLLHKIETNSLQVAIIKFILLLVSVVQDISIIIYILK